MSKFLLGAVLFLVSTNCFAGELVNKLLDVSVNVSTGRGQGSGVLKTRKMGNDNVTFIWTAHHVIDGLRRVHEVIDGKTGTKREVVSYEDANIVQSINEDGRLVAKYSLIAKVVKTSEEEDLALLMVYKKNFSAASAQFYLDPKLPPLGDDVWNVGSALGIEGYNTVSKGVYSQHGRLLRSGNSQKVYDQVSCPGFPGCSGSGVFLNDGRMIGMLTNGAGETYILVVPARRIIKWAKDNKLDWAIDDNTKMPTEDEINKIVVEDNGTAFSSEYRGTAPGSPKHGVKNLFKETPPTF